MWPHAACNTLEREAAEQENPDRLVEINFELHHAIHCAAHNRYLLQSLASVVDTLGLLRHSTFVLPGSARQAHAEHQAMVSAIGRRDAKAAETTAASLARCCTTLWPIFCPHA